MQKSSIFVGILLILTAVADPDQRIRGAFALQGSSPTTAGYLLAPQFGNDPLRRRLDLWMTPTRSALPIRSYRVDMTQLLHMIIVSDDFRTFLHLHPMLQANGHFLLEQQFPSAAMYHVYADAQPEGFGRQVFRFDLNLEGSTRQPRDLSERGTTSRAGPYVVRISTNKLSTHVSTRVIVEILKDAVPATDLHPYLGALAHVVFLNAGDLSYVHVHPAPISAQSMPGNTNAMGENAMKPLPASGVLSPDMQLDVKLSEPGTYKLWLQFRGGNQVYVAPFVVTCSY